MRRSGVLVLTQLQAGVHRIHHADQVVEDQDLAAKARAAAAQSAAGDSEPPAGGNGRSKAPVPERPGRK